MWHYWQVCPESVQLVFFSLVPVALPFQATLDSNTEFGTVTCHNSLPCGNLIRAQDSAASLALAQVPRRVHTSITCAVMEPFDLESRSKGGMS